MGKFIDLTGMRFERLFVIKHMGFNKHGGSTWLCICNCGNEKIILGASLRDSSIKSCGCLQKEIAKLTHTKHGNNGNKRSRIYRIWDGMLQRCTNPKCKAYKNYGERGITVCERWSNKIDGFQNFLEDMGQPPEGYELDRIDNNKGYCKSNCRWISHKNNNRNKRTNHLVPYMGKTKCVAELAEENNINPSVLLGRIRNGWPIKRALEAPVRKHKRRVK